MGLSNRLDGRTLMGRWALDHCSIRYRRLDPIGPKSIGQLLSFVCASFSSVAITAKTVASRRALVDVAGETVGVLVFVKVSLADIVGKGARVRLRVVAQTARAIHVAE